VLQGMRDFQNLFLEARGGFVECDLHRFSLRTDQTILYRAIFR
jgi:hypothetical protein